MGGDREIKEKMLKELMERKEKVKSMGGEKGLRKQSKLGKLTARERIDLLLDEGSFVEIGVLIKHRGTELGIDKA